MKISENKTFSLIGIAIVLLAALGQFQRFQLTSNLAIYLHDLAIIGWLGYFWLRTNPSKQIFNLGFNFFKHQREITISLIWIGLGWTLAIIQSHDIFVILRPVFYLSRLVLVAVFCQNLKLELEKSWPNIGQAILRQTSVIFGILILLWGLLQYYFLPDTRFLKTFGWDDHYFRLISTLFDPGFAGLILSITLIAWLGIIKDQLQKLKNHQPWAKVFWFIIWLALIGGILLTYSRATYLAIFGGLIWLGWKNWQSKQKHLAIFCATSLAILLVGIPFLPTPTGEGVNLQRTSTISSRVSTSQSVIKSLKPSQWWVGRGLFVRANNQGTQTELPDHAQLPDNLLVTLITGLGIGGIIIGLKLWGKKAFIWWQRLPSWLQGIWLATFIHSLFNNSLLQPHIWLLLQLLTA